MCPTSKEKRKIPLFLFQFIQKVFFILFLLMVLYFYGNLLYWQCACLDMTKSSYRFSGASFTGEKYIYIGPKKNPCLRTLGPASVEMVSYDGGWTVTEELVYQYTISSNLGVLGGGRDTSHYYANIEYINLGSGGESASYGDLTLARYFLGACSNSTIGLFTGGRTTVAVSLMDQVNMTSKGNAVGYGNLSDSIYRQASCGNSTYGYVVGGRTASTSAISTISYHNFANSGDTGNFGDITVARRAVSGCGSSTRGVFSGGSYGVTDINTYNTIDYITLGTSGSASDFGDLSHTVCEVAACSNPTTGLLASGYYSQDSSWVYITGIDKITIATTGNPTTFGDIVIGKAGIGSCATSTDGFFAGGTDATCSITPYNNIDNLSFSTGGTVANFGTLTTPRASLGACSNCHGGLG